MELQVEFSFFFLENRYSEYKIGSSDCKSIYWLLFVLLCLLTFCYSTAPGTFRLRFSSTTLNVANHFLNVPENSSGLVGGVSCLTDPFTNDTRLVYNITPNGVSGWYLNGSRLDDGTQGISISERVSSPVPMQFSFASLLIWPSVATRNLDGNYTCRVGSDSLVLVVHIQSECRGNATT